MGMIGLTRRGNPKHQKATDLSDNARKNEIARRRAGMARSTILSGALGPANAAGGRGSVLSSPGGV